MKNKTLDATANMTRAVADLKPHPKQSLMPPLTKEGYAALKESIAREGIHTPLTILSDGTVLLGHNRLRVAQELRLDQVPVTVVSNLNEAEQVSRLVLDNLSRRHLDKGQRAAIVTQSEVAPAIDLLEKQARDRQAQGGRLGGQKAGRGRGKNRLEEDVPQAYSPARAPQTRDLLGRLASVSGKLVDDARFGWQRDKAAMAKVMTGKKSLSAVIRALRSGTTSLVTSIAEARVLPLPEVTISGEYAATLICIAKPSTKSLALVWTVTAGPCAGAVVFQPVSDSRDDEGRLSPASDLGQLLRALGQWPEEPVIETATLIGLARPLYLQVKGRRVRVSLAPPTTASGQPSTHERAAATKDADPSPAAAPRSSPSSPTESSAPPLKKPFRWPGSEDDVPEAEGAEPRRCRSCGDHLEVGPSEICAECETEVADASGQED